MASMAPAPYRRVVLIAAALTGAAISGLMLAATPLRAEADEDAKIEQKDIDVEKADPAAAAGATTNARLAAFEGSKSRYSAQLRFIYTGSTLSHPLGDNAVNPGNANPAPVVKLESFIAGRYRIDDRSSIGLRGDSVVEKPLSKWEHATFGDPTIDYSYSYSNGGFHNHFDPNYEHFTSHAYLEQGFTDNLELYDNMIYETPVGLTFGIDWIADYNVFNISRADDKYRTKTSENDIDLSLVPALEYALTSLVSLRTQATVVFAHTRSHHYETYSQLPTAQLIGVTVNLGKYGYVNPYLSFAPYDGKKVTANSTSVGMAATINLF